MNSDQQYDVCMRLVRQYEILQDEARRIRKEKTHGISLHKHELIQQYNENREEVVRSENLIKSVCAGNSSRVNFGTIKTNPSENTEKWEYNFDFGDLLEKLNKL